MAEKKYFFVDLSYYPMPFPSIIFSKNLHYRINFEKEGELCARLGGRVEGGRHPLHRDNGQAQARQSTLHTLKSIRVNQSQFYFLAKK